MNILALAGMRRATRTEPRNVRDCSPPASCPSARASDRAVFHRAEACRGEPRGRVEAAGSGLSATIQMCDALSRNVPKLPEKLEIIVGHCNAHARRRFVEVTPNFPQECQLVLESLGEVYGYDEAARAQCMSSEQRLRFHQEHSGLVMETLHSGLVPSLTREEWSPIRVWARRSRTCSNTGTGLLCFCGQRGRRWITLFRERPEEVHLTSQELSIL